MLTRRHLLSASALSLAVPVLDACGGSNGTTPTPTPTITVQQAVTVAQSAVSTVVQEFSVVSPELSASQQATVTQIQTDLGLAQTVLKPLSTAMAANSAAPALQQAEQDFNAVVAAVSVVPLPPPYNIAVGALALSLPIIEGFVNAYIPTAGASLTDAFNRQKVVTSLSTADQAAAKAMAAKWQAAGR